VCSLPHRPAVVPWLSDIAPGRPYSGGSVRTDHADVTPMADHVAATGSAGREAQRPMASDVEGPAQLKSPGLGSA
jgi:hypothetical protein